MTIPFNTEPLTQLDCEWVGCRNHGEYILFFGCLNEHTQENVICHGHYKGWMEFAHSMICGDCLEHIDAEAIEFLHIRDVRPTNYTELLRDQQARIVARQFQDTFGNSYTPGYSKYPNIHYPVRSKQAPLPAPAAPVATPWPTDPQWAPAGLPEGIMGVRKVNEEVKQKDKKWWRR